MKIDKNLFINKFLNAIKEETAVVFAGAGMSVPNGFVNWTQLLQGVAKELGLDIEEEKHDLISLVQFYLNHKGNRNEINQLLEDKFGNRSTQISENHKILARLPIKYYWTTNYDNLIERSLQSVEKTADVKKCVENLSLIMPKRDAIVYKMHGDIDLPHQAVLTKDDYEIYSKKNELFSITLRGDLVSKTFLFLGFSFEDPNLNYILSRIRILLDDNVKTHYCIFKRVNLTDFKDKDEFIRAETKQNLRIEDLQRYGIQTILVNEYSEITNILKEIESKYKLSNIFISGSADEYGSWGEEKSLKFVRELSREIVKNEYKIISGFGKGIGFEVVNGALDYIYSSYYKHIENSLILRPFPYRIKNFDERKRIFTKYREDMLSNAGISLFIFGNKTDHGKIIPADGMKEEFEISKTQNVNVIPIGVTEYTSLELWNEVIKNFDKYYPNSQSFKNEFIELNNKNIEPEKLINLIVNIINKLNL